MPFTLSDLAALPTAPTISDALEEAARYTAMGPHQAIRKAMFGTTMFEDFVAVVTPDHAIAEGVALIVVASLIDPETLMAGFPDDTWSAGYFSIRVGHAHGVLSRWAEAHTADQVSHLFEAAADRARTAEVGR